jgi:hypothetical protein
MVMIRIGSIWPDITPGMPFGKSNLGRYPKPDSRAGGECFTAS